MNVNAKMCKKEEEPPINACWNSRGHQFVPVLEILIKFQVGECWRLSYSSLCALLIPSHRINTLPVPMMRARIIFSLWAHDCHFIWQFIDEMCQWSQRCSKKLSPKKFISLLWMMWCWDGDGMPVIIMSVNTHISADIPRQFNISNTIYYWRLAFFVRTLKIYCRQMASLSLSPSTTYKFMYAGVAIIWIIIDSDTEPVIQSISIFYYNIGTEVTNILLPLFLWTKKKLMMWCENVNVLFEISLWRTAALPFQHKRTRSEMSLIIFCMSHQHVVDVVFLSWHGQRNSHIFTSIFYLSKLDALPDICIENHYWFVWILSGQLVAIHK